MKGKTILLASAAVAMAAMTAAPATAAEWWESTKISGRMYYDFTNIDHDRAGTSQSDNGTSFDIKRFYVSIDHQFNDIFSADVTTDTQYLSSSGTSEIYVKKAYLEANLAPELDIRLGSTDLPWIPFVEGVYGYRYVENTLIDRTKFGTSADWGVHLKGKFADGLLEYAVSVVNGAGYKKPVRTDSVDVEGRISTHWNDFVLAVGGYTGKLGASHGVTTHHTANRFDALAAYKTKQLTVGFEYFNTNDWNNVTTVAGDSADGYSGFASYQFTPEWAVFGRYDYVQPRKDSVSNLDDNYYNVGIQYTPYKMINFALVYKHDRAENGFLATSNGTIGGTAFVPGALGKGSYDEVGLWGSFQW